MRKFTPWDLPKHNENLYPLDLEERSLLLPLACTQTLPVRYSPVPSSSNMLGPFPDCRRVSCFVLRQVKTTCLGLEWLSSTGVGGVTSVYLG